MEHLRASVSAQESDPRSLLAFYKRMIAWRKSHPALVKGDFSIHETAAETVSFTRSFEGQTILCAFNLSQADQSVDLPEGGWEPISGTGFEAHQREARVYLPAAQAHFAQHIET
jgi:alpha-glucosidase